jgi:MOSC domain-containing protein YiiM
VFSAGSPDGRATDIKSLGDLIATIPQVGRVEWLGVRPERRTDMRVVDSVDAEPVNGLLGDRYRGRSGARHATLIQAEHLPAIASCVGIAELTPERLRRNIVVSGINLLALKDKIICVASVEMEVTGLCHPCSRMEELLGPGGYNAVRGHGGITARVLTPGRITLGDPVRVS